MTNPIDRREVLGAASVAAVAAMLRPGEAAAQSHEAVLNVHILDIHSGVPGSGVKVDLFMRKGDEIVPIKSAVTGADGASGTLLEGEAFAAGRYLLTVDLSDYFKGADKTLPANYFRKLSLEFEVTDPSRSHHIPLQCTPWMQACSVLPG